MLRSISSILFALALPLAAFADTSATPAPSPTDSPSTPIPPVRVFVCSNNSANLTFDICGVKGCPATLSSGGKITSYVFKRARNSDGSLSYAPKAGSKPKCTVVISPLSKGLRTVTTASCAKALKGASCNFQDLIAVP